MLRCYVLGKSLIEVNGNRITPDSNVLFATLLYLGANAGRPIPRTDLAALLWPSATQARARQCLRQTLYRVTSMGLCIDKQHDAISVARAHCWLDWKQVGSGRAFTELDAASADVLPHCHGPFPALFFGWLEEFRQEVQHEILPLALSGMRQARGSATWSRVIDAAAVCLTLDPASTEAAIALAEANAMLGDYGAAERALHGIPPETAIADESLRRRAYRLREHVASSYRDAPSRSRHSLPLVGREELISILSELYQRPPNDRRVGAILTGDPGVGKTRIIDELSRSAEIAGVAVIRASCRLSDAERPLGLFGHLLPQLLSLPGSLGCSPEHLRYLTKTTTIDTSGDSALIGHHSPHEVFSRVSTALLDLFSAILEEGRLLLAIDDAHVVDEVSLSVLSLITDLAPSHRLAVIIAARPSPRTRQWSTLAETGVFLRLHIDPLQVEASQRLVLAFLKKSANHLDANACDECVQKSGGNPLFLLELVSHRLRSGDTRHLPLSIQAALTEHIASLSDPARRTLEAIAVLGAHATFERLERMLQYPAHVLLGSLGELDARGLIRVNGANVLPFHELVLEYTLGYVTSSELQYLYRIAAGAIEADLTGAASSSLLWACARAWELAGDASMSAQFALEKGKQVLSLGLPADAYRLALDAMRKAPDEEKHLALLDLAIVSARWNGQWADVRDACERYRALTTVHPHLATRARSYASLLLEARFRLNEDIEVLRATALEVAVDESAPSTDRHHAGMMALMLADNTAHIPTATRVATVLRCVPRVDVATELAWLRSQLLFHTSWGELDLAAELARDAIAFARSRGVTDLEFVRTLRWASVPLKRAGTTEAARALLQEAFEVAEKRALWTEAGAAAEHLTELCLDLFDVAAAEYWVEEEQRLGDLHRDMLIPGEAAVASARLSLLRGDGFRAKELLEATELPFQPLSARAELTVGCAKIEARAISEGVVEKTTIDRLLHTWERCAPMGGEEFNTGSLIRTLALNDQRASDNLYQHYLSFRRERFAFKQPTRTPGLVATS